MDFITANWQTIVIILNALMALGRAFTSYTATKADDQICSKMDTFVRKFLGGGELNRKGYSKTERSIFARITNCKSGGDSK